MIGRKGGGADLVLDEPSASRRHARILFYKDKWVIQDLKSRNGTHLNSKKLEPEIASILNNGTTIQIGKTVLQVGGSFQSHDKTDIIPSTGRKNTVLLRSGAAAIIAIVVLCLLYYRFASYSYKDFEVAALPFLTGDIKRQSEEEASKIEDRMKQMLAHSPSLMPQIDKSGFIDRLCIGDDKEGCQTALLEILLERGANPDAPFDHSEDGLQGAKGFKNTYHDYPLVTAARYGRQESVRLLLKHKANPDAIYTSSMTTGGEDTAYTLKTQCTALMEAASSNHASIARMLLDAGANPNLMLEGASHETALKEAFSSGSVEVVYLLLERGGGGRGKQGQRGGMTGE